MEMHGETSAAPAPVRRARAAEDWAKELRASCAMLSRAPVDALASVSVTVYPDSPAETRIFLLLCRCLAEEYGLRPEIDWDGDDCTARFCRLAAEAGGKGERSERPGSRANRALYRGLARAYEAARRLHGARLHPRDGMSYLTQTEQGAGDEAPDAAAPPARPRWAGWRRRRGAWRHEGGRR